MDDRVFIIIYEYLAMRSLKLHTWDMTEVLEDKCMIKMRSCADDI